MRDGKDGGLPLSRLMLEERLAVSIRAQERISALRSTPDVSDLPLRRFGTPLRLLIGLALGFAVSSFSILVVFVLVNMVLHVGV